MFCIYIIWNEDGEQEKKNCKRNFLSGIGKKTYFGAEFRPQNCVIESPALQWVKSEEVNNKDSKITGPWKFA